MLKTRTVLEITDTHIKFLQAKQGKDGWRPFVTEVLPVEGKPEAEVEEIILRTMQSRSIASEHFAIVLPRHLASIKRLRLASTNGKEIPKMVALQISLITPHPEKEIVYGYEMIAEEPDGHSQLLVYLVHKDVCKKYFRVFSRARISPSQFILSSCGITEWFNSATVKAELCPPPASLIVDLDDARAELCFIQDGKLSFSRSLGFGTRYMGNGKMESFCEQVGLSLDMYRRERMGDAPQKIFLIARKEDVTELQAALSERYALPVEVYAPPGTNNGKPHPGLSLTVCAGLLSATAKTKVNLITKELHDRYSAAVRKKKRVQFGGLLLLNVLLAASLAGMDLFVKYAQLNSIGRQIKALGPQLSRAEDKLVLLRGLEERFKNRTVFSDLMLKLDRIAPEEITFRSLNISPTGIVVGGYAGTGTLVNTFQSKMVGSKDFTDVSLLFTTKRVLYDQEVVEFKIKFALKRGTQ